MLNTTSIYTKSKHNIYDWFYKNAHSSKWNLDRLNEFGRNSKHGPSDLFPNKFTRYPNILMEIKMQSFDQFIYSESILFDYFLKECISYKNQWVSYYSPKEIKQKYLKSKTTFKRAKDKLIEKNIIDIFYPNKEQKSKFSIFTDRGVMFNPFFDTWNIDLSGVDLSKYILSEQDIIDKIEEL